MSEYSDERYQYVPEDKRERISRIKNPKFSNSCLEIYDFLHEFNNAKQYLSVAEFRRYIPLFSSRLGKELIKQRGDNAFEELAENYWRKINPYKEVYIVNSVRDKDVVAVLPPAAVTSPSMEDGHNPKLDSANYKLTKTDRPDILETGHAEYINLLSESRSTEECVKRFAQLRNRTIEQTRALDENRDRYYRGISPERQNAPSTKSATISFDEDEEIFD